jgi:hypothetical protein
MLAQFAHKHLADLADLAGEFQRCRHAAPLGLLTAMQSAAERHSISGASIRLRSLLGAQAWPWQHAKTRET